MKDRGKELHRRKESTYGKELEQLNEILDISPIRPITRREKYFFELGQLDAGAKYFFDDISKENKNFLVMLKAEKYLEGEEIDNIENINA